MHFLQVFVHFRIWRLGWPKMAARFQKEAIRRLTRTRERERERKTKKEREREGEKKTEQQRNRETEKGRKS